MTAVHLGTFSSAPSELEVTDGKIFVNKDLKNELRTFWMVYGQDSNRKWSYKDQNYAWLH